MEWRDKSSQVRGSKAQEENDHMPGCGASKGEPDGGPGAHVTASLKVHNKQVHVRDLDCSHLGSYPGF